MKTLGTLILLAIASVAASAQSRQGQVGRSAQGTLTVTVVVESSVGLVASPDGRQQLIVANAPDSRETFSPQMPAVAYNFPGKPVHFDIMRATKMLNVTGKSNHQPVTITTVVPR